MGDSRQIQTAPDEWRPLSELVGKTNTVEYDIGVRSMDIDNVPIFDDFGLARPPDDTQYAGGLQWFTTLGQIASNDKLLVLKGVISMAHNILNFDQSSEKQVVVEKRFFQIEPFSPDHTTNLEPHIDNYGVGKGKNYKVNTILVYHTNAEEAKKFSINSLVIYDQACDNVVQCFDIDEKTILVMKEGVYHMPFFIAKEKVERSVSCIFIEV